MSAGMIWFAGILVGGFGGAFLGAFREPAWDGATFAALPENVTSVWKGFAARCRRWRPGDLRLGLREAWCAAGHPADAADPPPGSPVRSPLEDGNPGGPHSARTAVPGGSAGAGSECPRVPAAPPASVPSFLRKVRGAGEASGNGSGALWSAGLRGQSREDLSRAGPVRPPPFWSVSRPGLLALRVAPNFVQVKRYLEEALAERPVEEFRGRLLFERRERFRWGASWRRCILDCPAGGVRLQWFANDDFGISELREFFEAPFFSEAETAQFYRWLGRWGWHEGPFRQGTVWMGVLPGDGLIFVEIFWREFVGDFGR